MQRSINVQINYNVQLIRVCLFQSIQKLYCCVSLVSCLYLPDVTSMKGIPCHYKGISRVNVLMKGCKVRISQLFVSPWGGEGMERGHCQCTDGLLTTPENTITYRNALCLSPQNFWSLAKALFSVSLGAIWTPKRNWRKCLCKILGWQTKSIMICYLLKGSIVSLPVYL